MKLVGALVLLAVLAAFALPAASACSCLPTTLREQLTSENVVQHKPVLIAKDSEVEYVTISLVTEVFNGCLRAGDYLAIRTRISSAACGVRFAVGEDYVSALSLGATVNRNNTVAIEATTNLCRLNADASRLLSDDAAYRLFSTRPVMCQGKRVGCAMNTHTVNCFVDPCRVSRCESKGAQCRSNYCGGCHAEYYLEDGRPTCYDCEDGFCGFYHTCNANNQCVPKASAPGDLSLF